MSDRLCLENNLSVIAEPEEKGKTYAEWNADKTGTSWKAKLKQTIDEFIPCCTDFEDFLRQIQERGYEVKRGKYISFRAPGQKRFTRMKTLGAAYDEDAVRLRIEGNERHEGLSKPHPAIKKSSGPDVAFLIDIQKKLAEGKGAGYEQWAKLFNLKSMANAMLVLQENGILSTDALDEKISSVSAAFEQACDQLKETESKLRQIRDMKKHIINYGRTREVYTEYFRSGKSEEFFEAHRAEISIHLAAKKAFDDTGTKKLPRLKDLERQLAELSTRQKQQYETYRGCRSENQKWQAVCQNVDAALGRMEKEKHRGVSR